jgi:hypothetical protein
MATHYPIVFEREDSGAHQSPTLRGPEGGLEGRCAVGGCVRARLSRRAVSACGDSNWSGPVKVVDAGIDSVRSRRAGTRLAARAIGR